MKKELTFEGYLYQDVSTNRQPLQLIEDKKGFPRVTLEKLICNENVVPRVSDRWSQRYSNPRRRADFVDTANPKDMNISKEFIRTNLKKVKVTVIIEEI